MIFETAEIGKFLELSKFKNEEISRILRFGKLTNFQNFTI